MTGISEDRAAAWTPEVIERTRKLRPEQVERVVVGVDPGARDGDERGIVVAGLDDDGDFYVLHDLSGAGCLTSFASCVIEAYRKSEADSVAGVVNLAGNFVADFLHQEDPALPFKPVYWMRRYADRVSGLIALYDQGRVHHVREFPELEKQMREQGGARVSALVAAIIVLRGSPGLAGLSLAP